MPIIWQRKFNCRFLLYCPLHPKSLYDSFSIQARAFERNTCLSVTFPITEMESSNLQLEDKFGDEKSPKKRKWKDTSLVEEDGGGLNVFETK